MFVFFSGGGLVEEPLTLLSTPPPPSETNLHPSYRLHLSISTQSIARPVDPKQKLIPVFSLFIWDPKSSLCRPRPFAPWELTLCFSRLIYSASPASSSLLLFRPPPLLIFTVLSWPLSNLHPPRTPQLVHRRSLQAECVWWAPGIRVTEF